VKIRNYCDSTLTFLRFALLADAPRVAADLMKNGADIGRDMTGHPDVTPLYLTLPRSLTSTPKELDLALRIACNYALPRTTAFLLKRGANVNAANIYGTTALHTAVMRRCPWREFETIGMLLNRQYSEDESRWESMLLQTVSALLDFGADADVRTRSSRLHDCDPKCWRSIDCDHQGQAALHIASASGKLTVVSRLLDAGANPDNPDGQGYTALYAALVQGHKDVACHILKYCADPVNPIVSIYELSTALHIASRFSFPKMVEELLDGGADRNVVDSHGRTPMQDAHAWARFEREDDVNLTLRHLAEPDAGPDMMALNLIPPPRPKTMQDIIWAETQRRCERLNRKYRNPDVPKVIEAENETVHKPVPNHFAKASRKASRNTTRSTASVARTGSEPNAAKLDKRLKKQAPPAKLASNLQTSAEPLPTLDKTVGIGKKVRVPRTRNGEETRSLNGLTKQTAGGGNATGSSEKSKEAKVEMGKEKKSQGRNRRRWTPLQV
jgi:ankyrin repeat protein